MSAEPVQERAARLRAQLSEGDIVLGCFLSFGSAAAAEMIGAAGYDCAVIDLEHGAGGEREAFAQLQALAATGCAGIVRVESKEAIRVQRVLDSGAHGIMFPRIESAEEARAAVAATRYAPRGVRGLASSTRACMYGANFKPYLEGAEALLRIVQIESPAAVEAVEEIAAVEGVDVLFVGPFDLSFSMGILGEMDDPRFVQAVKRTGEAAAKHGKQAGLLLPAAKTIANYAQLGYRFIVSGSDATLLSQAVRAAAADLQKQRTNAGRGAGIVC